MSEAVRETLCTSCAHRYVCKHKENYIKVCEAVFNTKVNEPCEDGKQFRIIPITNFEFLDDVFISCKFHAPEKLMACTSTTIEKHGEWDYWKGWFSNSDLRLEDATCPFCGYEHPVIRYDWQAPRKLPKQCPNCNAFLDIHEEDK